MPDGIDPQATVALLLGDAKAGTSFPETGSAFGGHGHESRGPHTLTPTRQFVIVTHPISLVVQFLQVLVIARTHEPGRLGGGTFSWIGRVRCLSPKKAAALVL
jgi:hypothetical protein